MAKGMVEKAYDVSVIIPVYNVEKYLDNCLNSVYLQTNKNIEIICIDDSSTDSSAEILKEYEKKIENLTVIKNKRNYGSLYARKLGVLKARGNFIMFLDGDDFLENNACEIAHTEIIKNSVDILQFGVNVINKGNVSQSEADYFVKFITPYVERIEGNLVLEECFMNGKYSYNLANKIFRAEICKIAFENLDDEYYCMAEDMLAYFVLSYFSKSYIGIPDMLYNYNFGIGISKPGILDLEGLDKRCAGAESVRAVERFLYQQGSFEKYKNVYASIERRMLLDNFDAWYYRLPGDMREQGYAIYEKHWRKDKAILGLLYGTNQFKAEYERITNSISYKIGLGITWLPRKIVKFIRILISGK